ncbi:MAG: methylenetetrahydrofolate--tRNA-(uracil(54)-C(5))-methyltransferase (FADH(2)-oxidizing) TrmFO [Alphaproteobacteria bacterium]|nr:MAG: methylenetetrahydrofolate--tRNA-(uracil(54)-C(5))-methyltransferase (FADH(2)-oxidizing) TrmFO [Alphaproteobacteria bacterium]
MTHSTDIKPIHIIGGGMAGAEAAWQAASMGVPVTIHEMRPVKKTDAHKTDGLAELVCSNSFRSDDKEANAVGVLHEEMRLNNSIIIGKADKHALPAGGALAVDRDTFSQDVTETLESHPLITIDRAEVQSLPSDEWDSVIIATGPLTSTPLAEAIQEVTGEDALAFFDALAPIVHKDSIDMSKAWMQSRYDKVTAHGNGKDYINCPMTKDEYYTFIDALIAAEKMEFKEWEKNTPYFEGCMPIEVMAERGPQTLSFGPMKPVGLTNPHSEERTYAVVQLRQDNKMGTLFNIVGFQTKMKYGAQVEVFRSIPGLENAEFARLGGIHRNTFINSPKLLDETLRLKNRTSIRFAGQITGCEGYVESASIGLMVGRFAAAERLGLIPAIPPRTTAMGSLLSHITGEANPDTFQPMNINFGLFPDIDIFNAKGKRIKGLERKKAYAARALEDMAAWIKEQSTQKAA